MSIRYCCSILLLFLILIFSNPAGADRQFILFATESWVDATEKDGSGLYWDILRAVYEPEDIEVRWQIKSYSKSIWLVQQKRADAVIGVYENEVGNLIYPDAFFAVDVVSAVALKSNKTDWQQEETLRDKKTGWIKGYSFDSYLSVPVKRFELYNRSTAMRTLKKGRIDFFLDAAADIKDYIKNNPEEKLNLDLWEVKRLKLYVAFRNDERGEHLKEIFDRRFKYLFETGAIQTLYDHYIDNINANFTNPFPLQETVDRD